MRRPSLRPAPDRQRQQRRTAARHSASASGPISNVDGDTCSQAQHSSIGASKTTAHRVDRRRRQSDAAPAPTDRRRSRSPGRERRPFRRAQSTIRRAMCRHHVHAVACSNASAVKNMRAEQSGNLVCTRRRSCACVTHTARQVQRETCGAIRSAAPAPVHHRAAVAPLHPAGQHSGREDKINPNFTAACDGS